MLSLQGLHFWWAENALQLLIGSSFFFMGTSLLAHLLPKTFKEQNHPRSFLSVSSHTIGRSQIEMLLYLVIVLTLFNLDIFIFGKFIQEVSKIVLDWNQLSLIIFSFVAVLVGFLYFLKRFLQEFFIVINFSQGGGLDFSSREIFLYNGRGQEIGKIPLLDVEQVEIKCLTVGETSVESIAIVFFLRLTVKLKTPLNSTWPWKEGFKQKKLVIPCLFEKDISFIQKKIMNFKK